MQPLHAGAARARSPSLHSMNRVPLRQLLIHFRSSANRHALEVPLVRALRRTSLHAPRRHGAEGGSGMPSGAAKGAKLLGAPLSTAKLNVASEALHGARDERAVGCHHELLVPTIQTGPQAPAAGSAHSQVMLVTPHTG